MLLHIPIAIMATLSPIAVSDSVPQFDIARKCGFEGGSTVIFRRCSQDETAALSQLRAKWTEFGSAEQKTCMGETTIGSFASYVELLTCLEMTRYAATSNNSPDHPRTKPESGPRLTGQPDFTIGERQ